MPEDYASRAFSSEVDTGSREENASKQESRAPFRFYRNGTLDHDEFRLRRRDHADLSRKRGEVNQMSTSIQLKTIMHPAVLIVGKSAISVISPIWRVMSGSCRNWK